MTLNQTTTTRLLRNQGVTAAAGFRAAGIAAGIKKSGRPDLALVFNEGPDYAAAAVFTRNQVKAAPVLWSAQVLRSGRLRAVLLNSGGANACTGPEGFADSHATAEAVAATLSDWGTDTGPIEVAIAFLCMHMHCDYEWIQSFLTQLQTRLYLYHAQAYQLYP